ncbi:MAG: hypothetical protein IMZ66_06145, partial [Planctomycetes bacterium]|nr:hypothetical protein [Planctomycetota bacterium]
MSINGQAVRGCATMALLVIALEGGAVMAAAPTMRVLREGKDPARAVLEVRVGERSSHAIPRDITGKFCEHLGTNIYNGMDAQVLRNPTLADFPFGAGQSTPDGVTKFHVDDAK